MNIICCFQAKPFNLLKGPQFFSGLLMSLLVILSGKVQADSLCAIITAVDQLDRSTYQLLHPPAQYPSALFTDEEDLNTFLAAKRNYTNQLLMTYQSDQPLMEWRFPRDQIQRLAFFEVAGTYFHISLGLPGTSPYRINSRNFPSVMSILSEWNQEESISIKSIYKLLDAYSYDQILFPLRVESWRKWIHERRQIGEDITLRQWQNLLISNQFLNQNIDEFQNGSFRKMLSFRKFLLVGFLYYLDPTRSAEKVPFLRIQRAYEEVAEVLQQKGAFSAYEIFQKQITQAQSRWLNFRWFSKVANLSRALTMASVIYFLGVHVDQNAYPVSSLWTSPEQVISQILILMEAEYEDQWGEKMSPKTREFLAASFQNESVAQLILELRSLQQFEATAE